MKKKIVMAALLATSIAATAETKLKTEPVDSLKSVELQEVQVTSTRATKKTPVAYQDLNQQQIKEVNFGQDVPYLLSLTPSVTTTSDAGNGIGYTTIRVRGVDPSRINITANGVPVSDAESAQVFWVNMGDFASSVQSMQIQRGLGTSTNGAGAFGATLNMQTENIGIKPYVGLDVSGGSYYSHKETLRFGTGLLADHWGIQGRLSNIGSKGYLDRASTKLNSYFLQAGYFGDNTSVKFITWNGVEETYHAWNYTSKYEQSLYGRRYNSCGEYYDEQGNRHYYDGQTDNYHQQNYQLVLTQILNRNLNFDVALHYTKGQGYYEEYKTNRKLADYLPVQEAEYGTLRSDLIRQKKMDNDFYGGVASVNYDNHNGLQAAVGGGWNKYDGDHFGLVKWVKDAHGMDLTPDFKYYDNNAKKTDFNIYGKVNYEFLQGLNGYLDLQYRHVGYKMQDPGDWYGANPDGKIVIDDKFNFFNPKAGIMYQINPNHNIYTSIGLAHKEPTRNDYEDNLDAALKAEQLTDWELGYKFQSKQFSAGANFYWMNYKDQFVLTGELNSIGEMIAKNVGKSYRMGVELEAAWKPIDWFRWDVNATFSKNRAKDWTVELDNGETANLGDTHLSFSPDVIFNNIFTFDYKGFKAAIQSQFLGEQYLTNTGFKSYSTQDDNGNPVEVGMMLEKAFTTIINLSYTFALKSLGLKSATVGCSLYNIFSKKYDNNGWAAPGFKKDTNGKVTAYTEYDQYEAGFAPSAPFNMMAHLSLNF